MSNGRKAHWKTSAVSDMTTGSPIRLLLGFAAPLFVGNLFQQLYSAVDTMIAGYNLGDTAVAAIGATSALYSLLVNLAAGLNSGYGIVAQSGGGDGGAEPNGHTGPHGVIVAVPAPIDGADAGARYIVSRRIPLHWRHFGRYGDDNRL